METRRGSGRLVVQLGQDYLGGNALPALILIAIGVALVLRPRAAP